MSHKRNEYIHEMERLYIERAYSDIEMGKVLGTDRTNVNRIRRLMEQEMGIPFYLESPGRYRIDPQHRIHLIPLNPQETLSLYLGARRLQQLTRSGQKDVASALKKLAKALRKPMGEQLVEAASVILEQEQDIRQERVLATLVECWIQNRCVRIHHRKLHGQVRTYLVRPYQIEPAVWGDGIYLIGQSDYHNNLATFKVARIEHAFASSETFPPPADFDVHTLLKHAWGIWHADAEPVTVKLHFSQQVKPRVMESVWHPSQTIIELEDGGCIWQAEVAEWQEMEPWVRGWGAEVEVLEPVEMRNQLIGEARRLASLYGWSVHRGPLKDESKPDVAQTFRDFFGGA
jgi:predicted DNA-binding transcriptional regulator YafY